MLLFCQHVGNLFGTTLRRCTVNGEERGPRKVLVVSNTGDSEARRFFAHALEVERSCRVVSTTADELFDDRGVLEGTDAVLFDDVDPAICTRARSTITTLIRVQPPIRAIVVLVGDEDYDHVNEMVGKMGMPRGRVCVHLHSRSMEKCLDFLAGLATADDVRDEAQVVMPTTG